MAGCEYFYKFHIDLGFIKGNFTPRLINLKLLRGKLISSISTYKHLVWGFLNETQVFSLHYIIVTKIYYKLEA